MAEIVWTEPALIDLDAIADYVALENPEAARQLVQRVIGYVEQLADHPLSGSKLPEFEGWPYRQIIEPPCRAIYRHEKGRIYVLHVVRGESLLEALLLVARDEEQKK